MSKTIKAIPIWQPKYKDGTVLVDIDKLEKKTYIFFCCDKNFPNLYSFDGEEAFANYDSVSNGTIECIPVPLKDLVDEGTLTKEQELLKEKELEKMRKYNTYKEI